MGKQVFATSFAGRELSRMMTWGTGDERIGEYRAASPCEMCNAPQHILEPILLARARELGANIRLNHEVLSIAQDDEHVTARVRPGDGGPEFDVVARYAIGATAPERWRESFWNLGLVRLRGTVHYPETAFWQKEMAQCNDPRHHR